MFGMVIDRALGINAGELAGRLLDLGVDTRPFFVGMHAQPALLGRGLFANELYPVTDYLAGFGLYIPSGLALTDKQAEFVVAAIHEAIA
jgi:perosamine synthetase